MAVRGPIKTMGFGKGFEVPANLVERGIGLRDSGNAVLLGSPGSTNVFLLASQGGRLGEKPGHDLRLFFGEASVPLARLYGDRGQRPLEIGVGGSSLPLTAKKTPGFLSMAGIDNLSHGDRLQLLELLRVCPLVFPVNRLVSLIAVLGSSDDIPLAVECVFAVREWLKSGRMTEDQHSQLLDAVLLAGGKNHPFRGLAVELWLRMNPESGDLRVAKVVELACNSGMIDIVRREKDNANPAAVMIWGQLDAAVTGYTADSIIRRMDLPEEPPPSDNISILIACLNYPDFLPAVVRSIVDRYDVPMARRFVRRLLLERSDYFEGWASVREEVVGIVGRF